MLRLLVLVNWGKKQNNAVNGCMNDGILGDFLVALPKGLALYLFIC